PDSRLAQHDDPQRILQPGDPPGGWHDSAARLARGGIVGIPRFDGACMSEPGVRVACLRPDDTAQVAALFATIATDPAAARFHPHPFGPEDAIRVCKLSGDDIYAGVYLDGNLVGYGMLRGWDEGFEIPALGIYLAPAARGSGVGRQVMAALHAMALERGAKRVMLKVYPDNDAALALY